MVKALAEVNGVEQHGKADATTWYASIFWVRT